jgi:hypothetical protein
MTNENSNSSLLHGDRARQRTGTTCCGFSRRSAFLKITLSSTAYRSGSDLILDVAVRNDSRRPVTIFGRMLFGAGGGFIIRITTSDGKTIRSPFLVDEQVPVSAITKRSSYIVLQPQHYLGTTLIEPTKAMFERPGNYDITVWYLSPVPRRYFGDAASFAREDGLVKSNTVTVRIE